MRILYHAINGTGLGHLMRLSVIAREVAEREPDAHQLLVTSAWYTDYLKRLGLPFLILPKDDSSPFGGTDQRRGTVSRWTAVSMLYRVIQDYAPRLAVFDTHFAGPLVRQLRDEGIEPALVLRLCRESYLRTLLRGDGLAPFSLILMPHDCEELERELPEDILAALAVHPGFRAVGPIVRRVDASPGQEAALAERYGLNAGAPLILITCGSGGYQHLAAAFLRRASAAASLVRQQLPATTVLVVGGPYGSADAIAPGCRAVPSDPDLPLLMARADLVVGHGGYNTVHEVLQAGARAVLVPMARSNESQEDRVDRLAVAGRVWTLPADAPAERFRDVYLEALRGPRPEPRRFEGAARAAEELLERLPRPRRLALCPAPAPRSWTPVASAAELVVSLGTGDAPVLLAGWRELEALAGEPAVRQAKPCEWFVDLGEGEVPDLAARAGRALAALDSLGSPVSLIFTDESGGARLAGLCEALARAPLQALIARVPGGLLAGTAEARFQAFEACRRLQPGFAVDVTPLENPCLAPDRP